ncbi:MAG: chemotaxis protein CheC [Actinomycetota bacterium]|nr:chemotaxis protein CheC [Actinomycetota bacterium]
MNNGKRKSTLSDIQVDALKEVGNIGAGNAGIALSQIVGEKVTLSIPKASVKSLGEVPMLAGGPEVPVAGVFMPIEGNCPGSILLLLEANGAMSLAERMVEKVPPSEHEEETLKRSALQEAGSILAGAYLRALGQLTGLFFRPSVPGFAMDMAGAIIDYVLVSIEDNEEEVFVVEVDFEISGLKVEGHLVLFPERGTLSMILERLGVGRG